MAVSWAYFLTPVLPRTSSNIPVHYLLSDFKKLYLKELPIFFFLSLDCTGEQEEFSTGSPDFSPDPDHEMVWADKTDQFKGLGQ